MNKNVFRFFLIFILITVIFTSFQFGSEGADVFSAKDVMNTRYCNEVQISPNGLWIAYTVSVMRAVGDKSGSSYRELYIFSMKNRQVKPFITGSVSITSIQWKPDSSSLAFLAKRGEDANTQVWMIPVDGGEAVRISNSKTDVDQYEWSPLDNKIAYTATEALSDADAKKEKQLKDNGFDFIFYEENLKHKNLYMLDLSNKNNQPDQLTNDVTVWNFVFSPNGKTIAAAITTKNLVDYEYMFRKIYLLDIATKKLEKLTDNPGKLGNFAFSPDGAKLAYHGALDQKDEDTGQLYVIDVKSKEQKNLSVPDFRGHVIWVSWKDSKTVLYMSNEGVFSTLSMVPAVGGTREIILNSEKTGIAFDREKLNFTADFKNFAFIGSSPAIAADIFYWKPGLSKAERLTDVNPWIASRKLGKQEVIRYKAKDGLEIEGILVYPVDYREGDGRKYPLIVDVHGGPESIYSQRWLTRYGTPTQVLAGKGYVVFLPNYRASSGYGYKFAIEGYKDPAGKEFDDIADGIDYLIGKGIADPDRVGLGGGSYGGYAAAWFATYYTKYVRAVCMFVGISDIISKRGTTDIPYEEQYVHSGDTLENMWELELKRSPIYWAHQSKTAVLIAGGASDPRVHPSQSLEMFRQLKMNNHPAVRLVQYPGEGHGNRNQPGQIDLLNRMIQWYDWYVMNKNPLDGPMPPLDISDCYK